MIFDTHAHYDATQFDEDREALLSSMAESHVRRIVNIGSDRASWEKIISLTDTYDFIYGTLGIHPSVKEDLKDAYLAELSSLLQQDKIIAVGEIGLDYYWDKDNHSLQKDMLIKQLEIAKAHKLPVVIHSREAAADTYDIMKTHWGTRPAIIHCYSYSLELAKAYVKLGYYIGVGGVVTFPNGKKLKEVVQGLPLSALVMETDCPYLAPVPFRGKRNDSAKLIYVAEAIARLKDVTLEEVLQATWDNGNKVYGL